MSMELYTVHELRTRWRPIKEQLKEDERNQSILIRVHRCFSWLQCAEDAESRDDLDSMLIHRWIAFNALYGRWDPQAREPEPDKSNWREFVYWILELDDQDLLETVLKQHRPLVMSILEDEFLTNFFWEEPSDERARKSKKTKFDARTWYLEERHGMLLERVIERIYLLRCQLIHGAATHGGRLNRKSLRRCAIMLGHIIEAIALVTMQHGAETDWGLLCYPPLKPGASLEP